MYDLRGAIQEPQSLGLRVQGFGRRLKGLGFRSWRPDWAQMKRARQGGKERVGLWPFLSF